MDSITDGYYDLRKINRQIKDCIFTNSIHAHFLLKCLNESLLNELAKYKIDPKDFNEPYDEKIYTSIMQMTELRDIYIDCLDLACNGKSTLDVDTIVDLFENLYTFTEYDNGNDLITDHYKFFINELFLYTTIILLDNRKYNELNDLLRTKFFVKSKYKANEYNTFGIFEYYIKSLDINRKDRLQAKDFSITADLLVKKSKINKKDYKDKLTDADLILYYLSIIHSDEKNNTVWFPATYVYHTQGKKIDLLKRMISKKYFDKVKLLFNVDTAEDMKKLLEEYNASDKGYKDSFDNIPIMKNSISPDEICQFD